MPWIEPLEQSFFYLPEAPRFPHLFFFSSLSIQKKQTPPKNQNRNTSLGKMIPRNLRTPPSVPGRCAELVAHHRAAVPWGYPLPAAGTVSQSRYPQ